MTPGPKKYRKKPVVIEAVQMPDSKIWTNYRAGHTVPVNRILDIVGLFPEGHVFQETDAGIHIPTLEGTMLAAPGDWIIKGVAGEFYPCKPEIFEATYERVEIESASKE